MAKTEGIRTATGAGEADEVGTIDHETQAGPKLEGEVEVVHRAPREAEAGTTILDETESLCYIIIN